MQFVAKNIGTKKQDLTMKPFAMNYIKIVTLSKLFSSYLFMVRV